MARPGVNASNNNAGALPYRHRITNPGLQHRRDQSTVLASQNQSQGNYGPRSYGNRQDPEDVAAAERRLEVSTRQEEQRRQAEIDRTRGPAAPEYQIVANMIRRRGAGFQGGRTMRGGGNTILTGSLGGSTGRVLLGGT